MFLVHTSLVRIFQFFNIISFTSLPNPFIVPLQFPENSFEIKINKINGIQEDGKGQEQTKGLKECYIASIIRWSVWKRDLAH